MPTESGGVAAMGNEPFEEPCRSARIVMLLTGGRTLKRDDDLIRHLMLEIEADPDPLYMFSIDKDSNDAEREKYFHLRLLSDAGLLQETGKNGGVFRMTSQGHDFLGAIRDDTIWIRTKDATAGAADIGLGMLRDLAMGYLRQKLIEAGFPLG